jgi:hypothetical protein
MNERIQKLAEQAYPHNDNVNIFRHHDRLEKFAELIVRECMACSTWVGKMNTNSVEPVHTAHAINQRIKQQFGVEL